MGIRDYLRNPSVSKIDAEENKRASRRMSRMSVSAPPPAAGLPPIDEKTIAGPANVAEILSSAPQFSRGTPSVMTKSSAVTVIDEIKHEVMVNYLYQQQCSQLWVGDDSGIVEGVLLRKVRGQYMACPPQLGLSPFAIACAALNVQVRL